MDGSLGSLIKLYVFTSGRRIFALRQVRTAADQQALASLVKLCDTAIAHDTATRKLERRWAGEAATGNTNPEAQRIDVLLDSTLGAIRDAAVAQTRGAMPNDPIHAKVDGFVRRIFPVDVGAVTKLPFIEELATVDDIVKLLHGELAPDVTDLGLGRLMQRLADLAKDYREALEAPPQSLLDFGRVRAANDEGQGLLLEVVAVSLGTYHERTAEGTEKRLSLLAPILKQNDAIGQYHRARRAPQDVNPETGEDEPAVPGGAPAMGGEG